MVGYGFSPSIVLPRGYREPVVVLCKLQLPGARTVPYDEPAKASVPIDMAPKAGQRQSFCVRRHTAGDCLCKCCLHSLIDPWTCESFK